MRIRTVEYRKLVTHGQYNNTTIGAVGEVAENEDPALVLDALETWVSDAIAVKVKSADGLYDEQQKLDASSMTWMIVNGISEKPNGALNKPRQYSQQTGSPWRSRRASGMTCHSDRGNE